MDLQKLDTWELIQGGYFEQACQKADLEYDQTKDILPLRNKVYALFHLEKYEEIISLTYELIKLRNGETDTDFIFCGIAHWLIDEKIEAIKLWQRAEQSIYKDAAGGMDIEAILYFASIKIGDSVLKSVVVKKIKKLLKSKRSVNWPGPLGYYLLEEIGDNSLLSFVSNVPILRERHLCQAYFVMAIKELEKGNIHGYSEKLRECINYGPSAYLEQIYYLAKGELRVPPNEGHQTGAAH